MISETEKSQPNVIRVDAIIIFDYEGEPHYECDKRKVQIMSGKEFPHLKCISCSSACGMADALCDFCENYIWQSTLKTTGPSCLLEKKDGARYCEYFIPGENFGQNKEKDKASLRIELAKKLHSRIVYETCYYCKHVTFNRGLLYAPLSIIKEVMDKYAGEGSMMKQLKNEFIRLPLDTAFGIATNIFNIKSNPPFCEVNGNFNPKDAKAACKDFCVKEDSEDEYLRAIHSFPNYISELKKNLFT